MLCKLQLYTQRKCVFHPIIVYIQEREFTIADVIFGLQQTTTIRRTSFNAEVQTSRRQYKPPITTPSN